MLEYNLEEKVDNRNSCNKEYNLEKIFEKGFEIALKKGYEGIFATAFAEGFVEGFVEGYEQVEEEQTLEIATNLIKFGMEPATIAKAAKRPLQWVENLISQNRSD
ncbi:MAG: hypothetical protein FWG64_12660 [Firmicutes bacterium]|nr:hypothetical protein [Bacillota bacterium]